MITKDKVTEIFCIIDEFDKNLCSALTAYCFFENKPEALPVYVQKPRQLELFSY